MSMLLHFRLSTALLPLIATSLVQGAGAQSFTAPATVDTGLAFSQAAGLGSGDLNGDGLEDIIASKSGELYVYINTGSGTFSTQFAVTNAGGTPTAPTVADINDDGKADIIYCARTHGYIAALLGDGNGQFTSPQVLLTGLAQPTCVSVADINRDGLADIAFTEKDNSRFAYSYQQQGGTWTAPLTVTQAIAWPSSILVSDLDGNGYLDLACSGRASDSISISMAVNDGVFGAPTIIPTGCPEICGIRTFDANADGLSDIAFAGDGIGWLTQTTPLGWSVTLTGQSGPRWKAMDCGRIGTGITDGMVVAYGDTQAFSSDDLLQGNGPTQTIAIDVLRECVILADFTGSPLDDLLIIRNGGEMILLENIDVLDCDGDGLADWLDQDCNNNLIADSCEIQNDASLDMNANGILDSCEQGSPLWFHSPNSDRLYTSIAPATWNDAALVATQLHAKLVTIRNPAQGLWINQFFGGDWAWIGLHDQTIEGSFEWISGEPITFLDWAPGAPGQFTPDQDFAATYPPSLSDSWDTWFTTTSWRAILESNTGDCDNNSQPDGLEIALTPSLDCNGNALLDSCEIVDDPSLDCNGDGLLDECQTQGNDCDGNGTLDSCDIANNPALDCDGDGALDSCFFLDPSFDCDANGAIDTCEIQNNPLLDCDFNGVLDICEAVPPAEDCDSNGQYDSCEIAGAPWLDCNGDGVLDSCQSFDPSLDCDLNGLVDSCEIDLDPALDCNLDGVLDTCQGFDPALDCDLNGLIDTCEIASNAGLDCNDNGTLDSCDVSDPSLDWNGDGVLDSCLSPNYCDSAVNSTGNGAIITVTGSPVIADNNFTLIGTQLPPLQWSYFVMSQSQAYVPGFGGSQGTLCVGAPIVRFNITAGPGNQIDQSNSLGYRDYTVDFGNLPQMITFQPGDTWNFQLWYRDQNPGQTSNTTDGISVMFR